MATNTSLALADAIIGNRKDCGLGSRSTSGAKWSDVREVAAAIVDDAAEHYKGAAGATGVLSDIARFSKPTPAINPVRIALPDDPSMSGAASAGQTSRLLGSLAGGSHNPESLLWAAGYNAHYMRRMKESCPNPEDDCMCIQVPSLDGGPIEYWMCSHKYRHYCYFVKLAVGVDGAVTGMASPFESKRSIDLWADFHAYIAGGGTVSREVPVHSFLLPLDDNSEMRGAGTNRSHLCDMTSMPHHLYKPRRLRAIEDKPALLALADGSVEDDEECSDSEPDGVNSRWFRLR